MESAAGHDDHGNIFLTEVYLAKKTAPAPFQLAKGTFKGHLAPAEPVGEALLADVQVPMSDDSKG